MNSYRMYSLDDHGLIGLAENFSAADDREAVTMVHDIKPNAVQWEVWDGHRLVAEAGSKKPA